MRADWKFLTNTNRNHYLKGVKEWSDIIVVYETCLEC